MNEKKKFFNRLILFVIVSTSLLIVSGIIILSDLTSARYLKTEQDEIMANYAALYFNHKLINKSAALENNVGYIELELMNFEEENVTQRDIEYEIKKPSVFYDDKGQVIDSNTITDDTELYVLDVWGTPVRIANATSKYDVSVAENDGETVTNNGGQTNYCFKYEKLGQGAVGKTHHITVKLERKDENPITSDESVSLVVQLIKPYREVYVINIAVSNKLIVYSLSEANEFGTEKLSVQSVNLYSHYYEKTQGYVKRSVPGMDDGYYTSKAIKVTITYQGLYLDLSHLDSLHLGLTDNKSSLDNLDITKPRLYFESGTKELTIYVPQGSNFVLEFVPEQSALTKSITIKTEVYIIEKTTQKYIDYSADIGGYTTIINDISEKGVSQFTIID